MKAVAAILLSAATAVVAIPPGIPNEGDARSMLSNLKVAEPNDDGSYDRDLFPHWSSVEGNCSAREYVLRRDGDNVETGNDCYPTSGSWTSPYEGEKHTDPSDVSVDHMVPLKNAWISGASEWTTDEREAFANDIEGPQLWAVTGTVNSDKSDKSPDEWKPELKSIHCKYAAAWIAVKSGYELTASSAEVSALEEMLGEC